MMKALNLVLALGFVASIGHADIYQDRANVARERAIAAGVASRTSALAANTANFSRLIRGFISAHGGLAGEGVCRVAQLVCRSGYCMDGEDQQVAVGGLDGQALYIRSCSVTLGDGLACVVDRYLNTTTWNFEGLSANCYDANSVEHSYHYLGSGAKHATAKKRKK